MEAIQGHTVDMGLDAVEIVLRTEELFAITIADDEASRVSTVGDFYRLICAKLHLQPLENPVTLETLPKISDDERWLIFRKRTPLPTPPEPITYTPESAWATLVAIFVDQQGLDPAEIRPHARIAQDLGVD